MRIFNQILIISSFLLISLITNGQTVSNNNGIKDFIPGTIKRSFANIIDPIGEWPGCTEPKDILISEDKDHFIINWDGGEKRSNLYDYEFKFSNNELESRIIEKSFVDVNRLEVRKVALGLTNYLKISVRRRCKINDEIYYSNWVQTSTNMDDDNSSVNEMPVPCIEILKMINIVRSSSFTETYNTATWSNTIYDNIKFVVTSDKWVNNGEGPIKQSFSQTYSTGKYQGNSTVFPGLTGLKIKVIEVTYNGNVVLVDCSTTEFINPVDYGCLIDATIAYVTQGVNTLVSINSTGQTASGIILSGGNSYPISTSVVTIPCGDFSLSLTGVNSQGQNVICNSFLIENDCPCDLILGPEIIFVTLPTCNTLGKIGIAPTGYLTSIGGDFSSVVSYSGLQEGVYTVRLKNIETGCITEGYTVVIPAQPSVIEAPLYKIIQYPGCNGQKGIIEFQNSGSNLQFSIGGLYGGWTSNPKFFNMTAGTSYQLCVRSSVNCASQIIPFQFSLDPIPTPSGTSIQPSCTSSINTGTITVQNPLGSQYLYSINNGVEQSSPTFANLPAGQYVIQVRNINTNCTKIFNSAILPIASVPTPVATIVKPTCTLSTGGINISSPTGSSYSYSVGGVYKSSRNFTNLLPGTYYVTVRNNSSGCISTPLIIIIPELIPEASVTVQPNCTQTKGTIYFTYPTSGYEYSINNGLSYQTTRTFSNLNPGVYQCKFRNGNCVSQALTIQVNSVPTFDAPDVSVIQPTCSNQFGSASITTPIGSNFTYSINNGSFQSYPNYNNLSPGSYTLIVKNLTTNCLSIPTDFQVYFIDPAPSTPTAMVINPSCISWLGMIIFQSPINNANEYSIDGTNYFSSSFFENVSPGYYGLTCRNRFSGCTSSEYYVTVQNVPLGITNGPVCSVIEPNCNISTGSITINSPLGGNYGYSINGGGYVSSPSFNNLTSGQYSINYINYITNCVSPPTLVIISNIQAGISLPLHTLSINQTECNPINSSISIIQPLGNDFEYRINGGNFQSNPIFKELEAGDYKVEYRNSISGCLHPNQKHNRINGFPCDPDPEFVCGVISNFIGVKAQNSFILRAPDNLFSLLEAQGISHEGINYQFNFIKSLKLQLDYEENNIRVSKTFEIFDKSMFIGPNGIQNFNILNWSVLIENVNTQNFHGSYKVIIELNDGAVHFCNSNNLVLTDETVVDPSNTNNFPSLPVLNCNTVLPLGNTSSNLPKERLNVGDIFIIQAFPIQITSFTQQQTVNGIYSGYGILPIPFGSKNVLVEFNNIFINEYGVVTQGQVSVVRSGPTPSIANAGPLVIGGDICIPPPPPPSVSGPGGVDPLSGLDPYGFNPTDGLHSNGTPFDDNGFDINGYYQNSEPPSLYNPNGCSRESKDKDGNPCEPTYNPDGPLPEVDRFLVENESKISTDIITILNALKTKAINDLAALGCVEIRQNVIDLSNGDLGYSNCFTIGSDQKYVAIPGMLDKYTTPLIAPELKSSHKNPNTVTLEKKHADLYNCATKAKKYQLIIENINSVLNDPTKLASIQNFIKNKIENWDEEEAGKYIGTNNEGVFTEWLTEACKDYISENANVPDLFSLNIKRKYDILPIQHEVDYIDYYHSMASINSEFSNISNDEQEELDYYMKNNFSTIKGIDRAFYLEAMSKNINLTDVGNNVHALPITITKPVGSLLLTLILDNVYVTTTSGILDGYIIVEDPETGRKVVFKGLNIAFNTNGLVGNNKLTLDNNVELRINNAAKLILKGNQDTYVNFNCSGFAGMGIDADIEFCRNFIVPLDQNLNVKPDPERYNLSLKTTMDKWLDFTFTFNAPPFALAKYENVKFQLTNMVLDMSSMSSPPITFPKGYQNPIANTAGWRGFYIENLTVTFPNEFSKNNVSAVASIHNFVIDGTGVSGEGSYRATILSLADGSIGGWGMSIEEIGITVLHNHLANFKLAGQLELPLFGEPFNYIGYVYPNKNYKFSVLPKTNLSCNLLLADAILSEGSGVSIGHDDLGFNITANLNGKLTVKGSESINISLPEVKFENVVLSNRAPYFSPGNWPIPEGFGSQYKAFDLNIDEIRLYKPYPDDPQSAGLLISGSVSFQSKMSISLQGGIGIAGKLFIENDKQKWKYTNIKVEDFCLAGSFPGVDQIVGCVKFFENDSEYGDGFKGGVSVNFTGFLKELKAVGQFGKVGSERYFFVDASASFTKGIPLVAGIELKGFSGGASYHMNSTFDPNNLNFSEPQEDFQNFSPDLGVGFSGMTYHVNMGIGLGIKAGAMFTLTGKEKIFNGAIEIGMKFYEGSGGLAEAYIVGIGQFLADINLNLPIKNPKTGNESPPIEVESVLSAYIFLKWLPGKISGTLEAFLNAGPVKGSLGNNGKLVNVDLEFTSGAWHVYFGHPDYGKRCGIKIDFGFVNVESNAYFCMGTQIPDMPELPQEIQVMLPNVKSNKSLRGGGGGIIFGGMVKAGLHLDLIGIVQANAEMIAGYDVMIRQYQNMSCNGKQIGINGWYGAGQLYAAINGELKFAGINMLKLGIGAVLQARLPNPTFVAGTIGVYIDTWVLSGKFDLSISAGQNCNITSSNPDNRLGMEVIQSINPLNTAEEVNVDIKPQVDFALAIDKMITIKDFNGNDKKYLVKIKEVSLVYDGTNEKIKFTQQWNLKKTSLKLVPIYFLPPNHAIKMTVLVEVFEGGIIVSTEERVVKFTTGGPLEVITESNIKSTYPMNGMQNFHKDEVDKEYIELNQGAYDVLNQEDFNLFIRVNNDIEIPVVISKNSSLIEFDISSYLSPQTNNKIDLVRLPKTASKGEEGTETILYTIDFRTSKYNKFLDKMVQLKQSPIGYENGMMYRTSDEPFDGFDTGGSNNRSAVVVVPVNIPYDYNNLRLIAANGYMDNYTSEYYPGSKVRINIPLLEYKPSYAGDPNGITTNRLVNNSRGYLKSFYEPFINGVNGAVNTMIENGFVLDASVGWNLFYSYYQANPGKIAFGQPNVEVSYFLPNGKRVSFTTINF